LPLDDIAPQTVEFVDKYIDQFVTWDVLAYFHENPDVERKPSGIALDIGRRLATIEPVLAALEAEGVVEADIDEAGEPNYRYSASAEFRKGMEEFLTATRDRTNRLAIVGRVLQKEAKRL
jgi:DNA-binding MarR family transcriptional regulator